jgi:cyclophilin family peptidyl-prolyl cis-trans isomerase
MAAAILLPIIDWYIFVHLPTLCYKHGLRVGAKAGTAPYGFTSFTALALLAGIPAALAVASVVTGGLVVLTTPSATGTPFAIKHYSTPPPETPAPQVKQHAAAPPLTIDTAKTYTATIRTDKGDIQVELFAKDAPNTVNNFVFLARDGFYDDLPFHYVEPDFSVQTGDPTGTGSGGPGYEIVNEPNSHPFEEGTLGMINGSQFFIVIEPSHQFETGDFWPFGKVTAGMEVVRQLGKGDKMLGIDITEQ